MASCSWTDFDRLAQHLDRLAGLVDLVGRPDFLVGLIEVVVLAAHSLVQVDLTEHTSSNHVVGSASYFAGLVALVEQVEHTSASRGLDFDVPADLVGLAEHF